MLKDEADYSEFCGMKILLCAATRFEIGPTLEYLNDHPSVPCRGLITGIGMLATSYHLTRAIQTERPDFILQAGIAGAIDRSLPLTKVLAIRSDFEGDLGVVEQSQFRSVADMGFQDPNAFPFQQGKLYNDVSALESAGVSVADAVTVNQISTDPAMISYYASLGAAVESMEGAALHFIALSEQIKFLQLRSLSNFAGERDKTKWMTGMAIARLNDELIRILSRFE